MLKAYRKSGLPLKKKWSWSQPLFYAVLISASTNCTMPAKKTGVADIKTQEGKAKKSLSPPAILSQNCTGTTLEGLREGLWICLNTEGKKTAEIFYKRGLKDGNVKIWNRNGVLDSESEWRKGQMVGHLRSYHPNGVLHIDLNYDQEQRMDGPFIEQDPLGRKLIECIYKKGKLDGIYKQWDSTGALVENCHYTDGQPRSDCTDKTDK